MIPAEHFSVMREQQNAIRSAEERELIDALPSHIEFYLNSGGTIKQLPSCAYTENYKSAFVLPLKRDAL